MAFKNGQGPKHSSVVEIGREAVRRFASVPLAVGIVGRMLYLRDSEREWLKFGELPKISQNNKILSTLKLSYDKLPYHLKCCFVYCSLFPKNFVFKESFLIELWMAQGFIESQEDRKLEDIGHDYLIELVSRLFFLEIGKDDEFDTTIICKMHDLSRLVAGSSIVTRFDVKMGRNNQKPRHMPVYDGNTFSTLYDISRIQTVICFKGEMDFEKIISSFKFQVVTGIDFEG